MNAKYLGDAKDFAKAFLFKLLREKLQIQVNAVPFFTGEGVGDILPMYASILGIRQKEVLLGDRLFSNKEHGTFKGREDYIRAVMGEINKDVRVDTLFLDPDTGIKGIASSKEHVTYKELRQLLGPKTERLLIVYDELYNRNAAKKNKRKNKKRLTKEKMIERGMRKKLSGICKAGISGFGYYGNALNLIFLANSAAKHRLMDVLEVLTKLLPKHRIIPGDGRVEKSLKGILNGQWKT